jgi:hypothetical protein
MYRILYPARRNIWFLFLFTRPENSHKLNPTCPWMSVFESKFLNCHITAILPAKTLSRPLWRPQIFTAIQLFKTATFEESGRDGGHLATLPLIVTGPALVDSMASNASKKHFKNRLFLLYKFRLMIPYKYIPQKNCFVKNSCMYSKYLVLDYVQIFVYTCFLINTKARTFKKRIFWKKGLIFYNLEVGSGLDPTW